MVGGGEELVEFVDTGEGDVDLGMEFLEVRLDVLDSRVDDGGGAGEDVDGFEPDWVAGFGIMKVKGLRHNLPGRAEGDEKGG